MELQFAEWRLPTGKPFGVGNGTESMVWKVCPTNWQLPIRQIGAASGRRPRRIKSDAWRLPRPIGSCQSAMRSALATARAHRFGRSSRRNWQLPILPTEGVGSDGLELFPLPIGSCQSAGHPARARAGGHRFGRTVRRNWQLPMASVQSPSGLPRSGAIRPSQSSHHHKGTRVRPN